MRRYRVEFFLPVIFTLFVSKALCQTSTISNPLSQHENDPYSRYGVGTPQNSNGVNLQGMGSITSAYESPYQMNTDNPASYAFLKLTTYEAGAQGTVSSVSANNLSYKTGTATLAYMNIGIPIGNHGGLCIGMQPRTTVYYNFADTTNTLLGTTQGLYTGSGSINYLYVGGAWRYKSLSIGVNAGYMFGTINNSVILNVIDLADSVYNSDFSQQNKIGGIYWKAGILYEHNIRKDITLRVGGTFSMKQNLNATHNEYWISTYSLIDSFIQDTAYNASRTSGKVTLPMSYSIGVQLARTDKWLIGIDYSATKWTQYRFFGLSDSLTDAYKISLGGEYTSGNISSRNYFSRVTYRAGLYYGKDLVFLNNTNLNYYGFTLGCSLPVKRATSHIHLGLDIASINPKSNTMVSESFVKFSIGFSFNDKWFVKRKYD